MSYALYSEGAPHPALRPSPTESEASGLRIGRLDVWPEGVISGEMAASWIQASGLDLVIVRFPSSDRSFARELRECGLECWQADTLLYFSVSTDAVTALQSVVQIVRISPDEDDRSDRLVGQVFAGYINHYQSSRALMKLDLVRGYQDWARAAAGSLDHAVFVCTDVNGTDLGIAVIDRTSPNLSEVLLAGVVPEARRQGVYPAMIRKVVAEEALRGASTLAISTQAANTGVMRAWCRLGFLPELSLDTLHVVRRASGGIQPESTSLP